MAELEKTFALVKPDAVRAGKAQEIMQLIELHGFTIIAKRKIQLTKQRASEFYGEHLGKPFFPKLLDFMTSGPAWALVLARPNAIKAWRDCMGPTNVFKAREEQPRCLRALYGTDGTQNACHGSDSPASAAREIKFFFPQLTLEPLPAPQASHDYITAQLQPALTKALTALAREKPSAEPYEAIAFLAHHLLANNPNRPRVVVPDQWDPSMEEEDDEAEFVNARCLNKEEPVVEIVAVAAAVTDSAPPATERLPSIKQASASEIPEGVLTVCQPAPPTPEARPASAIKPTTPPAATALMDADDAPSATYAASSTPDGGAEEEEDAAEMEQAAVKVQSAYRGFQARKRVADIKAEQGIAAAVADDGVNADSEATDTAVDIDTAATDIQNALADYNSRHAPEEADAATAGNIESAVLAATDADTVPTDAVGAETDTTAEDPAANSANISDPAEEPADDSNADTSADVAAADEPADSALAEADELATPDSNEHATADDAAVTAEDAVQPAGDEMPADDDIPPADDAAAAVADDTGPPIEDANEAEVDKQMFEEQQNAGDLQDAQAEGVDAEQEVAADAAEHDIAVTDADVASAPADVAAEDGAVAVDTDAADAEEQQEPAEPEVEDQ